LTHVTGAHGGADRLDPPITNFAYLTLTALTASLVAARDRHLAPRAPLDILDIGCGAMPYRPVFAPVAGTYAGADLPPNPLATYHCPAEELAVPDASFDVALSTQMLEHVREPVRCVAEMRRVLRPGGIALITTHGVWPYHPSPTDLWRWTHAGLETVVADAGGLELVEIVPHRSTAACLAGLLAFTIHHATLGTRMPGRLRAYLVAAANAGGILGDRLLGDRLRFPEEHSLVANFLVVARRTED
jgi:SAM-dependent methyltransferase